MKPQVLAIKGFTTLPGIAILALLYNLFTLKLFPAISIFVYLILLIALFTYPISQYLQHRRALKVLKAIGAVLLTVIATVILVRQFWEARYVVNHGMAPNLPEESRVIGDRTSYWLRQPERSDIVLLKRSPQNGAQIMRVVGLPSDRVEVRQGKVWINGKQLEELYTGDHDIDELASCPATKLARGEFYILLDDRTFHHKDFCETNIIPRQKILAKVVGQFYSSNGFYFRNF